jgi:phospholipid-binding lipoprotein MlaA
MLRFRQPRTGSVLACLRVLAAALVLSLPATPAAADEPDPLFDALDEEEDSGPTSFPDPIEGVNRAVFRFNATLDRWVLDPLTNTYRVVFPRPIHRAIVRVLANLNSSVILVNDVLQGDPEAAGLTLWRVVVNSTVGFGGILDPSTALGVEGHHNDFGVTLARYGVPSGPYLMFPVLGPTNLRDSVGGVIDLAFRPSTFLLWGSDALAYATIQGGSMGLTERADALEGMHALRNSSIDYYAALSNAYFQNRMAVLRERLGPDYGTR